MSSEFREAVAGRHFSTVHFATSFDFEHLPAHLQEISRPFHDLAVKMITVLRDGPELSAMLRKLREAKDCAVVQRIMDLEN